MGSVNFYYRGSKKEIHSTNIIAKDLLTDEIAAETDDFNNKIIELTYLVRGLRSEEGNFSQVSNSRGITTSRYSL